MRRRVWFSLWFEEDLGLITQFLDELFEHALRELTSETTSSRANGTWLRTLKRSSILVPISGDWSSMVTWIWRALSLPISGSWRKLPVRTRFDFRNFLGKQTTKTSSSKSSPIERSGSTKGTKMWVWNRLNWDQRSTLGSCRWRRILEAIRKGQSHPRPCASEG